MIEYSIQFLLIERDVAKLFISFSLLFHLFLGGGELQVLLHAYVSYTNVNHHKQS